MYVVRKKDGMLTKDYSEILNIQHDFYKKLYTCDDSVKFILSNSTNIRLDEEMKLFMDRHVEIDELYDAMMTLRGNKTPGGDGLTLELYRKIWNDIKLPLYDSYNQSLIQGHFSHSAIRGIINLIPKKGKDELEVKNWRPITLLNVDYKIWAKMIANRLEEATELIGKQQTGFIKNRSIFTNILSTMEVVSYLNKRNLPGIIVTIDFEKYFDRVEFASIMSTFKYFGFGDTFIKKLSLLFSDLELCTSSNGYVSSYLTKGHGTNQGDPSSPLIYCFCGEIMAHLILDNQNIRGLDLYGIKRILTQFADDTAAFLSYEKLTLDTFIDVLDHVEKNLGLKVSYDKTSIYRIGSLCNSNAKLFTQKDLNWTNKPIDLLGVKIPCDGSQRPENFEEIVTKVNNICENWFNRTLMLFGKVTVLNTLIGSLFIYRLSTMLNLTKQQIERIESIVRNFIWRGKKAKVSLKTLQLQKTQGGLKLFNLQAKQDSILISWIFKLDFDDFIKECTYANLDPELKEHIWLCNITSKDIIENFDENSIWTRILVAWSKINFFEPQNKEEVLNQYLWYNSHIKVNGKVIKWKHWWNKDIWKVQDLVSRTRTRKKASELQVNWLELRTIWNNLPPMWILLLANEGGEPFEPMYDKVSSCQRNTCNKFIYDLLISDDVNYLKYAHRWITKGLDLDFSVYLKSFKIIHSCTGVSKFKDFQYHLSLCKIIVNQDLFEWNKIDSNLCTLCREAPETLMHLFWDCPKIQPLLRFYFDLCARNEIGTSFDITDWILNTMLEENNQTLNFLAVFIKQFIYKCRCMNTNINLFKFEYELLTYKIEKAIAAQAFSLHKFNRKWSPIYTIVEPNMP